MASSRIAPAVPPFAADIQSALDRIMPEGMAPLTLFTTLARNPRVFGRFMSGGLLDKGTLSLRQRELVIDRACALCGCEYEWGVHVALFGERVGLGEAERHAIVHETPESPAWSDDERLILRLVDSLHDTARIPAPLWAELDARFTSEQLIELIVLTGLYHMVSFVANGLALAPEAFAPRFPMR
ncbi:carboxymuconolactone decarboxylase family protein [Desertibaculum subflavum]|uniref:carboxymuconolactone decarboxylase family protein n=1 Tax=Desertibaculum subflavum TaxID=2268458 RepID=UPI000E66D947